MKRIINGLWYLGTAWLYGVFLGIIFHFLKIFGTIRVLHGKRFPHYQGKIILVSNHPSLLDPFLLPALFFPDYLFYPFGLTPWSTPDRRNFYDRWWFLWWRSRSVPIDRTGSKYSHYRLRRTLLGLKKILERRGNIILFPEGGRTFKGKEFLYSKTGKRIRRLKEGISWLVAETRALVVPVWVEGTEKVFPNRLDRLFVFPRFGPQIKIKIGKPLRFNDFQGKKNEITQKIAQALLKLADEEE